MRRRTAALAGAAALLGLAAAPLAPSASAADLVYVSGPGSQITNYTVPVLAVRAGDNVTYVNVDLAPHDVVATTAIGPDEQWCKDAGFDPGECPLIFTPLLSLGQSSPIYGLDNVAPGSTVAFKCTIHPSMKGTLIVSPA